MEKFYGYLSTSNTVQILITDNSRIQLLTREFAGAAIVYGVGQAIPAGLQLLLFIILARLLSPVELGLIGLSEGVAIIVAHIALMGLPAGLRRLFFRCESESERRSFVATVLKGGIGVIFCVLALSYILVPWLVHVLGNEVLPPFYPYLALAILLQIGYQFLEYRLALFQVNRQPMKNAIFQIVTGVAVTLTALIAVISLRADAVGYFGGRTLAVAVLVILALWSLRSWLTAHFNRSIFREVLVFSVPLLPHVMIGTILNFADRYILELFQPTAVVGLYTLAYTLGMAMLIVTLAFSMAWTPVFYLNCKVGTKGLQRIRILSGKAFAVACLIACFGSVFAEDAVWLLFDERYHAIGKIVPIIIGGYLLHFLFSLFAFGVSQDGRTWLIAPVTGLAALLNIGLNFWAIPHWGMSGAAWVTLVSFGVEALVIYWISQRLFRIPYPIKRFCIYLILYAMLLWISQWELAGSGRLILYLPGIAVMGVLTWEILRKESRITIMSMYD